MMTMVSPEYIQKTTERTQKIQGVIEYARSLGQTDDQIKVYLIKKFDIPEDYAQNCLDAEWEEDVWA